MYSLIIHGRRSILELQKWGSNLSVPVNLLQNLSSFANSFTSTADVSLQDGRKGKNFAISYLVGSLGLTSKLAESISSKVSFEDKRNPDSVLSVLRSHGFTDSQISSIITIYPRVLIADAEKSLGPKLKFLQSRGVSTSELTEIVSKVPKILGKRECKTISRYYDCVKEIVEADKSSKFQKLCFSSPQGSKQENKIRNILVLRELGVPQQLLFSLLISKFARVCGKDKFEETLKKVVEMGFDPTPTFVVALRVLYQMREKVIEEKVNVYKKLGFAVSDVWAMFKKWPRSLTHSEMKITQNFETLKNCGLLEDEVLSVFKKYPQCIGLSQQKFEDSVKTFLGLGFTRGEFLMMVKHLPTCIGYSAESVKRKTEYLVKKMNWSLKAVVSNPSVLGYRMEKRIVPRCNVVKALMSKGLIGSELPPMSYVLVCTDETFLNRFVRKHGDDEKLVSELMTILTGKKIKGR